LKFQNILKIDFFKLLNKRGRKMHKKIYNTPMDDFES